MEKRKTVFVDCNDTLIAVRHANRGDVVPEGFQGIERGGQHYHVQARPSAAVFLRSLIEADCEIVVLTGGNTRIQHLLLNLAGLGRAVDDVVGYGSSAEPPASWVLVDDLQGGFSTFEEKLAMLGVNKKALGDAKYKALVEAHCIQCRPYKGGDDVDAEPLTVLLPQMMAKLTA